MIYAIWYVNGKSRGKHKYLSVNPYTKQKEGMENNIYSLRKSRGNSKYKLKSLIELTHKIPKMRRKNRFLASSSLSSAFLEKPRTSRVRPKGLRWKLIGKQILLTKPKLRISGKNNNLCTKKNYLPVLSESCLQHVYCSICRHGQRGSFVSDDKVLCQQSVNETILWEFQSKMIVFWAQYGVLLFPLNRP